MKNKLSTKTIIQRKIAALKREHKTQITKSAKRIAYIEKILNQTKVKYKELQKKHYKLHVENSKLRKQVETDKLTMLAIGESLRLTDNELDCNNANDKAKQEGINIWTNK